MRSAIHGLILVDASYRACVEMFEAGALGFVGGLVAGAVTLANEIRAAGWRWPWTDNPDGPWPRFTVYAVGLVTGGVVATIGHENLGSSWVAFAFGISGVSVVRGVISGIGVKVQTAGAAVEENQGQAVEKSEVG